MLQRCASVARILAGADDADDAADRRLPWAWSTGASG